MAINKTSIVIFSSGNQEIMSEELSILLSNKGYECSWWRNIFSIRENSESNAYALMPTLLKKIPTFDFAVIIGAGDDTSIVRRGDKETPVNTMRDNLIFEIGLCVMALGQERTILVADEKIRFIDDFIGLTGAKEIDVNEYHNLKPEHLGFECVTYAHGDYDDCVKPQLTDITEKITHHIEREKDEFKPIVIGASCSTAVGYVNNFVARITTELVNADTIFVKEEVNDEFLRHKQDISFIKQVKIDILIPTTKTFDNKEYYIKNGYKSMVVFQGGADDRGISFSGKIDDDILYVADIPTTMSTSYSTAKKLLSLEANDTNDLNDEARFVRKEIKAFDHTLRRQLADLIEISNKIVITSRLIDIN